MANALQTVFTDIATAIRGKTGKTDPIAPVNMASEIEGITGGGSGGGSGLTFVVNSAEGITAMKEGPSFTDNPYIDIPENAVKFQAHVKYRIKGTNSAYSNYFEVKGTEEDFAVTILEKNRKKISFGTFEGSVSGATYLSCSDIDILIAYEILGAYMKDGVLYAGEEVTSLFTGGIKHYGNGKSLPMIMKGADLRGSSIKYISSNYFIDHDEIEFIYLPECLESISGYVVSGCDGLKELHFTSMTPPEIYASYNISIPTTCTIYVPAGTLDTYKTATNYPDPTKYTYVEE